MSTVEELVMVDDALCNGCGLCLRACPTDVFRLEPVGEDANKAIAKYASDCCACLLCVEDCPTGAIILNLAVASKGFRSIYSSDEVLPLN